jgi:uncharacterized protein YtpQ (UPF0354 family)
MGLFDLFSSKPSPDKFAEQVLSHIREAGIQTAIEYNRERFQLSLKSDSDEVHSIFLGNLFQDYCNAPKPDKAMIFRKAVALVQQAKHELPSKYEMAKHRLFPLVRSGQDDSNAYFAVHDGTIPFEPSLVKVIAGELQVHLGLDSEHTIQRISKSALEKWGVSFDEALNDALNNLRDQSIDRWEELAPGVFIGRWDDGYNTSRLLLTDMLFRLNLSGDPVVLIPTRDTLLICGSSNTQGLRAMIRLAEEALRREPRHVSLMMLSHNGTDWQEFIPPPPDNRTLQESQMKLEATDYAAQKEVMDRFLERTGRDIFVASYILMQAESGELWSYVTWMATCHAWIPRAQKLFIGELDDQEKLVRSLQVPWEAAWPIIGHHLKPMPYLPLRYEVNSFPSDEEWAQLAKIAN